MLTREEIAGLRVFLDRDPAECDELCAMALALLDHTDRINAIADEAIGPRSVQSADESLTCIERALFEGRKAIGEIEALVPGEGDVVERVRNEPEKIRRLCAEAVFKALGGQFEDADAFPGPGVMGVALHRIETRIAALEAARDEARTQLAQCQRDLATCATERDEARSELERRDESFETWVTTLRSAEDERDDLRAKLAALADAALAYRQEHDAIDCPAVLGVELDVAIADARVLLGKS